MEIDEVVIDEVAIDEVLISEEIIDEEFIGEESFDENTGRSVFFLMPSDPKPPVALAPAAAVTPVPEETLGEQVYVLTDTPGLVAIDGTGTYVQIGAYLSFAVMTEEARRIKDAAPGYPLTYSELIDENRHIYKLLIGPLKPAEIGVVLQTARRSAFPDAFRYTP